jgi:CheY-like chemotaxis protein
VPLSSLRILIVDDYAPLLYLKAILLRRAGADVLEAQFGKDALRILQTEKVDVVLLDVNLPDISGVELRDRMRADPATSGVPVIFTSASDQPGQLGPDDVFFQEPLNTVQLFEAIGKLVRRT